MRFQIRCAECVIPSVDTNLLAKQVVLPPENHIHCYLLRATYGILTTTLAARRALGATGAAALALILLACAAAPAAATNPLEFDFGGGLVAVKGGKPEPANPWKAGVTPEQGAAGIAADASSSKAPAAAAAAASAASLTATVSPGSNASSVWGAWYDVAWAGISSPSASDRVAVLYTAKPDTDQHPIAYDFVGQAAPGTWESGSGTTRCGGRLGASRARARRAGRRDGSPPEGRARMLRPPSVHLKRGAAAH